MKMIKTGFVAGLAVLLLISGCSSAKSSSVGYGSNSSYAPAAAPAAMSGMPMATAAPEPYMYNESKDMAFPVAPQKTSALDDGRFSFTGGEAYVPPAKTQTVKRIVNSNIEMNTREFERVYSDIEKRVAEVGGYVESSNRFNYMNEGNREFTRADMVLKIPVDGYESVKALILNHAAETGKVNSNSESTQDVTAEYFDTEGRLRTKKVEEERLLELISKATRVEDLLQLEERLGIIRTEIEVLENRIISIDRSVAYCTIYLGIMEVSSTVTVAINDDFSSIVKNRFIASINGSVRFMEGIIIFFASAFVPLAFLGIILALVIFIYRRIKQARN